MEFQRVRGACNRRTRRNWFVLHGEKRDGERDRFYPVEEGSTETTPPLSSFFPLPLFLHERYLTYRVVVGESRVTPRSSPTACSLRDVQTRSERKLVESGHPVNAVTLNLPDKLEVRSDRARWRKDLVFASARKRFSTEAAFGEHTFSAMNVFCPYSTFNK